VARTAGDTDRKEVMTVVSDATPLTSAGIFAGGAVASGAMLRRGALVPKDTPPRHLAR
jgi:hypothetical protein